MKKNKRDYKFPDFIKTSLNIVWKSAPLLFVGYIFLNILASVFLALTTYVTQYFFDTINSAIAGKNTFVFAIFMAVCFGVYGIIQQVISAFTEFQLEVLTTATEGGAIKMIHTKSCKVDPIAYENPVYLDTINKASEGAKNCFILLSIYLRFIVYYLPYFAVIAFYLYSINPILAFAVIVVFIPHIINNILRAKVFTDLADQAAPLRRKYEYYEKCISDREYFKETRILGGFQYFHSLYQKALKALNKRLWDAEVRCDLVELFMYILTLIAYIGVLYLLVISMFQERVSVGEFAAVFTALSTAMALANNIMNGQVKQISGRIPSVTNFLNFLNLPERGGEDTNICAGDGVVLKDVVFRYPLSENNAIDGINLTIKKGETVAVVGENGSGKSTLVKLIMGLYVPDEGNVTMEGKNTRELKPQNIYAGISVVFQQFQKYKLTLLENISISKPDIPVLEEEVRSAAQKADVYSESDSYPQGYDTILSNEFDGVDLSGGQWQRVAIARGFYRNQSMILLDEPTAAIDPVEETRLYHKFAELSKDKTAIIVTHRLGSAKIADRIIVMDAGKMIGEGTHESLMLQCEKYSKMYDSQAKNYSKA